MSMSKTAKVAAMLGILASCNASPALAVESQKYRYDAKGRLVKVERTGTVNNGVATEYSRVCLVS